MTLSANTSAPRPPRSDYVLTLSCADTTGIVRAVSTFLADRDCNIVESEQYGDRAADRFFMRVQFEPADPLLARSISAEFIAVAALFGMTWKLTATADRQRVLVMVSKIGHCLNDLLYRTSIGALNLDIPVVVSNHPDLGALVANYGLAFRHIPVISGRKAAAEQELLHLVDELGTGQRRWGRGGWAWADPRRVRRASGSRSSRLGKRWTSVPGWVAALGCSTPPICWCTGC